MRLKMFNFKSSFLTPSFVIITSVITSSFVLPQELSGKGPNVSRRNTELKALASASADSAAEVVREPSVLLIQSPCHLSHSVLFLVIVVMANINKIYFFLV